MFDRLAVRRVCGHRNGRRMIIVGLWRQLKIERRPLGAA
jgi:hypothetical protein